MVQLTENQQGYEPAEYSKVWNEQNNKALKNKIIIAGIITGVLLIGVEVLFAILRNHTRKMSGV